MKDHPEILESTENTATEKIDMANIPPADRRETLRTFVPVLLIEVVLSAIMVGVFIAVGKFNIKVLLGALLGTVAEIINFTVMVLSLIKAEKADNPMRGQLSSRGNYIIRMVILLVVLVFALKSGYFNPIATLLPLCFMRIAIFVSDIVFKSYDNKNNKKEEKS